MRPPMRPVAKIPASPVGAVKPQNLQPLTSTKSTKVASCKHPIYVVVDILKYGPLATRPLSTTAHRPLPTVHGCVRIAALLVALALFVHNGPPLGSQD